ncbi:subtilase family protein [Abeliophyllum distichum]|uniref:Subtilase family protein n=1 Tax=Abeliophyllum distichum TaxID=126358 RepID=A0ABD1PU35_9LAMI
MSNYFSRVLLPFLLIFHIILASCADQRLQVYIVYLGEHSGTKTFQEIEDFHRSYLHSVKGKTKEEAKDYCLIYSYKNVINGFSALLSPEEAAKISEMDGVISVFHSHPTISRLHTTRSWDFINILEGIGDPNPPNAQDLLSKANYGKDVIVGVLDSGVWPESASFNDNGMDPVPRSWKGICQNGVAFNSSHCNRKLIGARYYLRGYEANYGALNTRLDFRSPRDIDGHGTHTSSTVGGRRVPNASSIGGLGSGTATGGAPLARLAIYKVCWPIPGQTQPKVSTCLDDDMLAAFDDAIADGVHVISVSIGTNTSRPYKNDGIAMGALHAVKRNIVVACSAGNSGPTTYSVSNVAPWIITVGASSIDRMFSSPIVLGNGMIIEGQSITPFGSRTYPLVYATDVENPGTTTNLTTGLCLRGTLSPALVRGKAVFCRIGDIVQTLEVQRAGGVATVLGNPYQGRGVLGRPYLIPATVVYFNKIDIYNYIETNQNPNVTLIQPKTLIGTKPDPFMAPFTSRGPSAIEPNILKPDITAPGLNILAAWSEASPPLNVPSDHRVVKYKIDSGTSMSCPHVAAVAALLKAIHPRWSSPAIKSAMMTTAKITNNMGRSITDSLGNVASPFEYRAGHIQPSKAADPGLVYDASYMDYLLFLCGSTRFLLDPFECPRVLPLPSDLNYPSLSIANLKKVMTVKRTVTNVGTNNSSYSLRINAPPGYSVKISPATLHFRATGEKRSFSITVKAKNTVKKNKFSFGSYTWSDGIHQVPPHPTPPPKYAEKGGDFSPPRSPATEEGRNPLPSLRETSNIYKEDYEIIEES